MAPTHFFAPDSNWVAAAVFLSGIIPVTVVAYISCPFVTYIHLRLPQYAQSSHSLLLRYSKNLPPTAELDITTMNFIGKPRVARMNIGDLKAKKARFGFAGFERDTQELNGRRKWWMGKPVRLFGVTNEGSGLLEGEVWRNVERAIRRGWSVKAS
ncbi:uncharacterized protein RAG0_10961 [Rhynchosporium agropyri]|uniref:Uncharacterized protein n=1 Tax=Rhynchosporium agropyri TaxID=914238 RepID=A0A1E1L222_9HELO|nr:uncharacterized protein RAG0_10961 [Rhynchosporium agropyri]